MGLVFSHGDVRWSYIAFRVFRKKLAKEIGIDLDNMKGFGGNIPFENFNDNIIPLLNHSDCDGELTVEECKRVALRLRELVSSWSDEDHDKTEAIKLASGMEYAIKKNEPFEFG